MLSNITTQPFSPLKRAVKLFVTLFQIIKMTVSYGSLCVSFVILWILSSLSSQRDRFSCSEGCHYIGGISCPPQFILQHDFMFFNVDDRLLIGNAEKLSKDNEPHKILRDKIRWSYGTLAVTPRICSPAICSDKLIFFAIYTTFLPFSLFAFALHLTSSKANNRQLSAQVLAGLAQTRVGSSSVVHVHHPLVPSTQARQNLHNSPNYQSTLTVGSSSSIPQATSLPDSSFTSPRPNLPI